jgi:hypothetical protein
MQEDGPLLPLPILIPSFEDGKESNCWMPKGISSMGIMSYEHLKGIRDMRKTSIGKVIDRQPCTNAEAQTFLWECVERPNGCPEWY